MRPPTKAAALALAALLAAAPLLMPRAAQAEGEGPGDSVQAPGSVVVHGVDTGEVAARLRAIAEDTSAGRWDLVASALDGLLAGELGTLHEEAEGVYVRSVEGVVWRIAALPPEGLAAWRELADPRAQALLAGIGETRSNELLERHARRLVLSTHGPRLVVALADERLARGDLRGAARLLEELIQLWPAPGPRAELPGVDRVEVVSRLAGLLAALDDPGTLQWLLERTPLEVLDRPSPAGAGATLAEELARALRRAAAPPRAQRLPTGGLRRVAEAAFAARNPYRRDTPRGREILGHGVPIGSAERPALLLRVTDRFAGPPVSVLHAVAPTAAEKDTPSRLESLWTWPSREELRRWPRAAGRTPFEPRIARGMAFLCWPSTRSVDGPGRRLLEIEDEVVQDLVVLSLAAEGRLVDQRGTHEDERSDGDPELERLSFSGPPLLLEDSLFVSLVGRSPNGGATELHIARFDLHPHGAETRLRLRWRRKVLDGTPLPPVRYAAERSEMQDTLGLPTGLAERLGLLYVGSNTGAVACLDGESGEVVWLETYERLGPSPRRPMLEGDPVGWHYGPVQVDGPRVYVAPRDAEQLLIYAARPLPSRSVRIGGLAVRGAGTVTAAGSPLGDLAAEQLVAVRDGIVLLAGSLPERRAGTLRWPPSPLVAYRARQRREGEPGRRLFVPEIAEIAAAGRPAVGREALLFATGKSLYRISLGDLEQPPRIVWTAPPAPPRSRQPQDRLGNLAVDGRHVWSVTPTRVVLFAAKER